MNRRRENEKKKKTEKRKCGRRRRRTNALNLFISIAFFSIKDSDVFFILSQEVCVLYII